MELEVLFVKLSTGIFVAGSVGCALLIPLVALKFFSVLLEEDPDQDGNGAAE